MRRGTSPLVLRAQGGDSEAWAELYRMTSPRLLAYLRSKGALDAAESEEDLMADAWVLAAQRIHEFEGDERAFTAWVFTIATNHLMNARRKTARRNTFPTATFTVEETAGEEDWLAAEALLAHLPERERSIVVLIDLLGFTSKEAGEILGLSGSAVRVARFRALKQVRAQLEAQAR